MAFRHDFKACNRTSGQVIDHVTLEQIGELTKEHDEESQWVFLEYLGKKDMNGVDLCEGDRCYIYTDNNDDEDGTFLLTYDQDTARFVLENEADHDTYDFDSVYGFELEVVSSCC